MLQNALSNGSVGGQISIQQLFYLFWGHRPLDSWHHKGQ